MTIKRSTVLGVICKKTDGDYRFLVTKSFLGHYTLLGGGIKRGENSNDALLREIKEEIGVEQNKILKIVPLSLSGKNSFKLLFLTIENTAQFFALELKEGTKLNPNWEIKQILWLKKDEAIQTLTFSSSRLAMERALELIESWKK